MFKAFNVRTENLFIDKSDNEPYRKVIETDYAFDVESGFGIIPGAATSFFEKSSRTEFGGKYAQGINHTSYRRPLFLLQSLRQSGSMIMAVAYIGNIHIEVLLVSFLSLCSAEPIPVQNTSIHQPVRPHKRYFLIIQILSLHGQKLY